MFQCAEWSRHEGKTFDETCSFHAANTVLNWAAMNEIVVGEISHSLAALIMSGLFYYIVRMDM